MVSAAERHVPCMQLCERRIPCLLWFEDALACYGVPTVVFDLYILVADIDQAAQALIEMGSTDAGPLVSDYYFLMGPAPQRRLHLPGCNPAINPTTPPYSATTVLLPAADWNVPIERLHSTSRDGFLPPLNLLIDALIDSLLDSPDDTLLQTRLTTYVSYLYDHCAALKTQQFADNMQLDHRQFHYDALTDLNRGTVPFLEEHRQIREEIRQGKRQPKRNPWYLPPETDEELGRLRRRHCVSDGLKWEELEPCLRFKLDVVSGKVDASKLVPGIEPWLAFGSADNTDVT